MEERWKRFPHSSPSAPLPACPVLQAETLDVEAQGLFAEASQEKARMDQVQERVSKYENVSSYPAAPAS